MTISLISAFGMEAEVFMAVKQGPAQPLLLCWPTRLVLPEQEHSRAGNFRACGSDQSR